MVLLGDKKPPNPNSLNQFLQTDNLIQTSQQFANSDLTIIPDTVKTVYVLQSEFAIIDERKETAPIIIGSDEATTCTICVFSGDGLHIIAHLDGSSSQKLNQIFQFLRGRVKSVVGVYIVGGYLDERGEGNGVVENVLNGLNLEEDLQFEIKLACVGDVNTNEDGSPKKTSLAFELPPQRAFAAKFNYKGPEIIRRRAKFWIGLRGDGNVYNTEEACIQIYNYKIVLGVRQQWQFQYLLQLDDQSLLQVTSTSPEHEAPDFVQGIREVCTWILQNNQQGADGEIIKYTWVENQGWINVNQIIQQNNKTYNFIG